VALHFNQKRLNSNMIILELFDPAPHGYYDEKSDQSVVTKGDSRKNRVTLAHLHQLRISHDVRKLEHEQKLERVAKQYTPTPEGGMGGLPPPGL
jgi:3'-phosphoadenosine 5'-phosphosulfate (PAPS) 3'-phosphatase